MQQTVPVTEHNVLDRGSLLHRLKWRDGSTSSSIADDYASFTVENYGRAIVVFDGYEVGPSIKDCAHQRRSRKLNVNKVNVTKMTIFSGKKDDFFLNGPNKQALIQLIMERMKQKGCDVIQAEGDIDVEIAKAAISMSALRPTSLLEKTQNFLFSCCFIQMFPNVLYSISVLTRWNPTSIISRFSNRCLVKQFVKTYCFCMPLQDVIRCPGCSRLERSRGSSESSKEKRQWKTVQKHSLDQSKRTMLWKPMILKQW